MVNRTIPFCYDYSQAKLFDTSLNVHPENSQTPTHNYQIHTKTHTSQYVLGKLAIVTMFPSLSKIE